MKDKSEIGVFPVVRCKLNLLVVLSILLLGCSGRGHSSNPESTIPQSQEKFGEHLNSLPVASPVQMSLGQTMPVSAQAIMAGQEIQMEVAQTPQQQEIGLMYRKSLAANRGMLFPLAVPQPIKFWMKNTLIPLDIVFLRNGVVKEIAANVPPCTKDPCPTYGPGVIVDEVIELKGGRALELGLKVGDRVKIQKLDASTSLSTPRHF